MRNFTNWPQQAGQLLRKPMSIKKVVFECQWLGNVDMHVYAKCEKNVLCGSRVMHIWRRIFSLTGIGRTDGRTHIVIIVKKLRT